MMTQEEARNKLFPACRDGNVNNINLALDAGADIEGILKYNQGFFKPIEVAAYCNHPAAVRLLVSRGAEMNTPAPESKIGAFIWATKKGSLEAMEALLELGANIEEQDGLGKRPIHYAVESNQLESLKLLLGWGALTTSRVKYNFFSFSNGDTALDMVERLVLEEVEPEHGTHKDRGEILKLLKAPPQHPLVSDFKLKRQRNESEKRAAKQDLQIQNLSSELKEALDKIEGLKKQNQLEKQALNASLSNKDLKIQNLSSELKEALNEIEGLKIQKQSEVQALNDSLSDKDLKIQNLNSALKEALDKIAGLKERKKSQEQKLNSEIQDLILSLYDKDLTIKKLSSELKESLDEVEGLKKQNQSEKQAFSLETQAFSLEIKNLSASLSNNDLEIKNLHAKLEELNQTLRKKDSHILSLGAQAIYEQKQQQEQNQQSLTSAILPSYNQKLTQQKLLVQDNFLTYLGADLGLNNHNQKNLVTYFSKDFAELPNLSDLNKFYAKATSEHENPRQLLDQLRDRGVANAQNTELEMIMREFATSLLDCQVWEEWEEICSTPQVKRLDM